MVTFCQLYSTVPFAYPRIMSITRVAPQRWPPWREVPFRWETLQDLWPRRLLHIPTMTSLEREEGNTYGDVRQPDYNILTYTWGRWRVTDGPRLDVAGVDWDIPAIDERAFTLESFRRVIQTMSEDSDFVWIDIVCIDQKRYGVKMDEIGRQGGIFANAKHVYIWLWTLPQTSLQAVIDDIVHCSLYLLPHNRHELSRDIASVLAQLQESVKSLLGDWWFSSLWTLQEGLLRRDAMILSREGGPVSYRYSKGSPHVLSLFISNAMFHLRGALEDPSARFIESSLMKISESIIESIKGAGYATTSFARNPNIQYGAARFRTVSDELDRIYGIISLYDLKVGATRPGSDASRPYTFEKLEDEFAAVLNSTSPLLGQMFIHVEKPRRTWQITQTIRVPSEFSAYDVSKSSSRCEITATSQGCAHIKGEHCPFTEFYRFNMPYENMRGELRFPSYFKLFVDDYVVKDRTSLPFFPENIFTSVMAEQQTHETAMALSREFMPDELFVLYLGNTTLDGTIRRLGLLLQHTSADGRQCRRLGTCIWGGVNDTTSLVSSGHWLHFEGEIY